MDPTTWTTAPPPVTQSDQSLPPPQNPSYYDHPQPQPQPIPLQLSLSLPNPNPNPNHPHLTSEPIAYYPQPAQQHLIQPQLQPQPQPQPQPHPQALPQYYHYQQPTNAVPASYYQDLNWQYNYSQVTANVVYQLQHQPADSNWVQQFAAATPNAAAPFLSQASQSHLNGSGKKKNKKKKVSKKTEAVQPASCDICKIVCTSNDVLEQHKLGKKHIKNASKMATLHTSAAVTTNPIIGPIQNPATLKTVSAQKLKRPASTQGDLESKRMKVVADGASAAAVRVCAACNVVCNSETVFNSHIAGQKHAASMKKYLAMAAV